MPCWRRRPELGPGSAHLEPSSLAPHSGYENGCQCREHNEPNHHRPQGSAPARAWPVENLGDLINDERRERITGVAVGQDHHTFTDERERHESGAVALVAAILANEIPSGSRLTPNPTASRDRAERFGGRRAIRPSCARSRSGGLWPVRRCPCASACPCSPSSADPRSCARSCSSTSDWSHRRSARC